MKKTIIILICIFLIIIISIYTYYHSRQNEMISVKKFNYQYEQYFDKEMYGADVATLINKAIDNNEKYEIVKNENDKYIEDEKYCLKVIIKFKDVDTMYEMESIDKAGMEGFLKNFSNSVFKITDYKYNKHTNRVGKIIVEEIKIGNI